jgi:hypothetical protein
MGLVAVWSPPVAAEGPAPSASVSAEPQPASSVTAAPVTTAPAASANAAAPASNKPAVAAAQGAIVVAIGDDAGPAARALARDAYADETLRPRIDDATARVLAGAAPPSDGPTKLNEIAEIRKAAEGAGGEVVTRRLLASLGVDLGAALVVAVSMRGGTPVARVLNVASGAFAPVELLGSIEAQADGTSRVKWTNVSGLLATMAGKGAAASGAGTGASGPGANAGKGAGAKPGPLAPKKEEPARSFWTSPWTWAGIGVVAAAGVVVFAVSQTQGDSGGLRLQGRVSP